MREITIQELMEENGWTVSRCASEIGCSIGQVSKIKNGDVLITPEFQKQFQSKFPNCTLVGGKENWKEKYKDLEERFHKLAAKYACQNEYIIQLNKILVGLKDIQVDLSEFEDMFRIKPKRRSRRKKL